MCGVAEWGGGQGGSFDAFSTSDNCSTEGEDNALGPGPDQGEAAHQVGGGVGGHKVAEASHLVRGGSLHKKIKGKTNNFWEF